MYMKKYISVLFMMVYAFCLQAQMIPFGNCFVGGAEIPDDRVVQFKYDSGGTFLDFTNNAQNHLTAGGLWKGEALVDAPGLPKDGFVNGDVVYVFVDYEQAMTTQGGSQPLTFEFLNGDNTIQGDAHIVSLSALPASGFSATAIKDGRIRLQYTLSPSSNAGSYNIYYDGLSPGTIDYSTALATVAHPGNSIILGPFASGINYQFGLRVANVSGKEELNTTVTCSAVADSVYPVINVTSPINYQTVTGNINITGTISDPTGNFSYYSVYYGVGINPASWTTLVQNVNSEVLAGTIASFNTASVSDGLYTINVYAVDTVLNENIQNVLVYVDNDVTRITSPQPAQTVFGTVNVTGTADDVLFKEYYLYLGEGENPSYWELLKHSTIPVSNGTIGSFDSTLYSGDYSLKLVIYNTNQVIAYTETVRVSIDNKIPYIEMTGLPNWSYVKDNFVNVIGRTNPGAVLTINTVGVPVSALNGSFTKFSALIEGVNGFSLESTSVNGLKKKLDYYLVKDTVSPVITLISPVNNYNSSSPSLTVSGIVEPGNTFKVNGLPVSVNSAGSFTHNLPLVSGANTFAFLLTDKAGNSTSVNRTYYFTIPGTDTVAPEFVDLYKIDNRYFNTSLPSLKFHLVDEKSGVNLSTLSITIDGKSAVYTSVKKDSNYNIEISVNPNLSNGVHTMTVNCRDFLGSQLIKTISFTVDLKKPFIEYSVKPDLDENYVVVSARIIDENTAYPSTLDARLWLLNSDQVFSETLPYSEIRLELEDESVSTSKRYYLKYYVGFGFSGQVVVKATYRDSADNYAENLGVFAKRIFHDESDRTMSIAGGSSLFLLKNGLTSDEMIYFYSNDFSIKSFYDERFRDFDSRKLKFVYPSYEIKVNGYQTYNFSNNSYLTVTLAYADENADSLEDYSLYPETALEVYCWDDSTQKFNFVSSFHDSTNNTFTFNTNHLSEFILLADLDNPSLTELSIDKDEYISRPRFVFRIEDSGSGVAWDNIELYFDDKANTYTTDQVQGLLIIKPDSDLSDDSVHIMKLKVYDNAGNSTSFEKQFTVGEEYTISEYIAFPSPADTYVKFRYFLTADAYQVQLRIYNESSRLVKTLEGDVFSDYNEIIWDLTDGDLKSVVNGTYFYKLNARFGNTQTEKRGKVIVMR